MFTVPRVNQRRATNRAATDADGTSYVPLQVTGAAPTIGTNVGDTDGSEEVGRVRDGEHERGPRLRTFLIADVRGYTRFTQEQGDEEAAKLATRFSELVRRGIADYGGELVELRGDEALCVFDSAREALRAAVELQRLFRTTTDGESGLPLGVGIGIDAGEAVPVEGGYRGGALNLAARLCSRAAPGEILASETVVSLARHVEGIRFEHRGTERFKGLEDLVKVIEVISESPLPPVPATRFAGLRRFRRRHVTRRNITVGALVAITAAAGSAVVFVFGSGEGGTASAAPTTRVALVLPREPTGGDDPFAPYVDGLLQAERLHGLKTETLIIDPSKATLSEADRSRLDDFDLVLLGGPTVQNQFAHEVALHPKTHFMFLDPSPRFDPKQRLWKLTNYSDVFFAEGPASYLAGYLSALMERREKRSGKVVVSIVARDRGVSENVVAGFTAGAQAAVPSAVVMTDYSGNFPDPGSCGAIANRQIDKGSRVVYAASGPCSLGALSTAAVRGVWGIGSDVDRSRLGPHILASTVKRLDQAVDYAIRSYLDGTLKPGPLDIGIERDAVGIVGINPAVPADIRKKLAQVEESRRRNEWSNESGRLASGPPRRDAGHADGPGRKRAGGIELLAVGMAL